MTLEPDFHKILQRQTTRRSALTKATSDLIWPTQDKRLHHAPLLSRSSRPAEASGRPAREITAQVVGLAIASVTLDAQAVVQVVDFYIHDTRVAERAEIVRLANADGEDEETKTLLLGYVREGRGEYAGLFECGRC